MEGLLDAAMIKIYRLPFKLKMSLNASRHSHLIPNSNVSQTNAKIKAPNITEFLAAATKEFADIQTLSLP